MQKSIFLLALFIVSGSCMSIYYEELNLLWNTWKNLHNKMYSVAEDTARYAIFVDNYEKITQHNSQETGVRLRLNKFADLTAEEFQHKHSGCAFTEPDQDFVEDNTLIDFEVIEYPSEVDWRNKSAVTPVKDQGQCGACWTFSTTGALEGFYAINKGQLLSFSEQQIVDCAKSAGYGCGGGWPYMAIQYAAQSGLELESEYPYVAEHGNCSYDQSKATQVNKGYSFVAKNSSEALKGALASNPVSVLIEANQNIFQFYSSGIIGSSDGCGSKVNHAVLAVGYGQFNGTEAFIIKNSWGESWGDNGYVYVSTESKVNNGTGVCGVLSQPVIPV